MRCKITHVVIILVRLAIATRGWRGDDAATESCGIAIAALAWAGQGNGEG